MRIENSCKECMHIINEETICDNCGKQLSNNGYIFREIGEIPPIELDLCNTKYDFCSYQCLLKFIIDKI
jgi:hypothetical protein